MPFPKTWLGTTGDYELSTNWALISVRNADFAWTISGSGTTEYYLRTAGAADPGFVATPPTANGVYIAGSAATKGTLGSLTAGQWGYGDNDTLGYSTVYVRLSAGGDPDAQDFDHVQFRQIPQATEHVRIPSGSGAISSNLDQSAVAIGDFIVEDGHLNTIGATTGYLNIDPNRFEFAGGGQSFINLHTANIPIRVTKTANAQQGQRGLYLRGSALTVLDITGGQVGLAVRPGETATATTIRVLNQGTSLWLGNGVTLTNLHLSNGDVIARNGITTTIQYGGKIITEENGAMTTVTVKGGEYIWKSSGTIGTFHMFGGKFDMRQSGTARTLSSFKRYAGSYQVLRNKEAVTITAETAEDTFNEAVFN